MSKDTITQSGVSEYIPDGWKIKKLSELGSFSKGNGITKAELTPKGVPCIRYGEIYTSHHFVVKEFFSFIPEELASKCKKIKYNNLLFSGSGETATEIGKCVAYCKNDTAYAGGDIIILDIPNTHRAEYISYYLNSIGRKEINRLGSGNSVVHIYGRDLQNISVLLPPKQEQDCVVNTLQVWDQAIEKTEKLIAAKEKQFEWLCQKFFTPNNKHNPSWKRHKIGEFLKNRKEKIPPTKEIPLYSLTIEEGVTAKTDRYNREFLVKDKDNKVYKVVYPYDIVFNPANLRWGAIARSEIPHKVVLSPIYEVYQILNSKIDKDFLKYALTCKRQIGVFSTKTEGTLIERMAVKADVFELCEISVPSSRQEQERIGKILNTTRQEIDLLKNLAAKYQEQKRGLMQKLLSGEWRIKTKEAA